MIEESILVSKLNGLSKHHRAAFSAACTEQLLPNYYVFSEMENWGDYKLLRAAIDQVWLWLQGGDVNEATFQKSIDSSKDLAPDTEEFASLFVSAAGDAVAAVIYTLQCCLEGDEKKAAIVGRLTIETAYTYLVRVNDPDVEPHLADPGFEDKMLQAPLMVSQNKNLLEILDVLNAN